MQGISDPQTFQLSEIVQKSSKSGIFTNKRLLMIKDGFLYYFSKVPSDYKGHEPNLMSSLKELPKSSIEIRSIQGVKLQSAKSSTLILTFNNRDMIDRQDIRKSLSSKNYNHPVKPTSQDLEQWKFIFTTVMKCRLWYASLVKLKQFFVKSQDKYDKFAEYMANFDPQIRSSLPQFTSKSPVGSGNRVSTPNIVLSPNNNSALVNPVQTHETSKYKMNKEAGIFEIQQSNEQYDEQITPKVKDNTIKPKKDEGKRNNISEDIPIMNIIDPQTPTREKEKQLQKEKAVEQKKDKIELKNIKQQKQNQKEPTLFKSWEEPPKQVKQAKQDKKNRPQPVQNSQNKIPPSINIQQKKKIEIVVNSPKVPEKKIQQIEDIIKLQQKKRAEQQTKKLNKQLEEKQAMIRKMADQIQSNRKAKEFAEQKMLKQMQLREEQQRLRKRLERQRREQDQYRRLRQSIQSNITSVVEQPSRERSAIKQINIPFEQQQKEFLQVIEGNSKQQQTTKFSRYSFKSDLSINPLSNERDTLNLFRNTISYISEVKIDNRDDIENYDFGWEIGQIYKTNDLKERISKQLQLAQFVRKASRKVQDLIVHYIDLNRPKESIKVDRNFFQIEIVCERGRIIRTQGSQQLIYPNQNHQRLKRTFKIYNQLNETIIKILKKKPNFPLRVPFSCLVEYKGYTALAKIVPSLKQKSVNAHQLKLLQNIFPTYNLKLSDFQTHGIVLSLIEPLALFKVTKEDESSLYKYEEKYSDFLLSNRKANISISSKKLFEEVKEATSASFNERKSIAEMVNFCRDIKKVMKANTPYLEDNHEFQFFEDFLKEPQIFMRQLIPQDRQKITGILLHFIQQILGIRMKTKYSEQKTSYFTLAIKRKYDLMALDVYQFSNNFEKYISQQKYDIAQKSLNYFKQLQEDYSLVLLRQVNFHLHQKQFANALEKLQLCQEMVGIHHPNKLNILKLQSQCYQAIGEISKSIGTLKVLLEETQYMFGQGCYRITDVYFMIADLLSRQGLIPELIQVYRKILRENKQYRQKVLMDFCRNLLKQDTDPHILLDFLQKEMPESVDLQIPEVQQFYGQVYFKMKNKPKAIAFFHHALDCYIDSIKPVLNLYEIISRLIECCSTINQKKVYHRNIISKLSSIRIPPEECRQINTYISCLISNQSLNTNERDTLIAIIEDNQTNPSQKLLEWNWIESLLKRMARCEQFEKTERGVLLGSIDANIFSENLILLNNPNFI